MGPPREHTDPPSHHVIEEQVRRNVYPGEPLDSVTFDATTVCPQGLNAVVLDGPTRAKIKVRWTVALGDASSSVGGTCPTLSAVTWAAILDLNNGGSAPDVTWEALTRAGRPQLWTGQPVRLPRFPVLDVFPIEADLTEQGTRPPQGAVACGPSPDTAATTPQDSIVVWSGLTAAPHRLCHAHLSGGGAPRSP